MFSLLILAGVFIYHLWASRKQEFTTTVFPSTSRIEASQQGFSIRNDGDLSINMPLKFDHILCQDLYVGPNAVLEGISIAARRIVNDGDIRSVGQIVAHQEVVNRKMISAFELHSPRLILEKKSLSVIQIVPKETRIVRKRGAHSRGFFSSQAEMTSSATTHAKVPTGASVHFLRHGSH
ncbi:MAG: hypothetical protein V1798_03370 [Pseudomonadota bacterium]